MDQLQSMKVFVRVAQREGFAAAARDLSMSPAAVTKHVAALESRIRARLFDRTTRSVRLTEAGRSYLERCLECLQSFDDAEASVHQFGDKPSGLLRVTAPVDFGRSFIGSLSRFMNTYPNVVVDLQLSNRPVDLVDERFDVALRLAPMLTGPYVVRPLAVTAIAILASPDYLRRYGRPTRPEDLERHRTIVFTEPRPRDEWTFERDSRRIDVKLEPIMVSNNGSAMQEAARAGVGLLMMPSIGAVEDIAAGMEPLLLDWNVQPRLRLFALYPHRRFLPAKVRLFVETLREDLGNPERDPWWPTVAAAAKKAERRRRPRRR
jgi:DNA-binding transcriptional LysR family regulator